MRTLTIAVYLACGAAALALVVISHLRDSPLATLSDVLDRVFADRAVRVVIIVFWWWLGWHFLAARTVDPPLLAAFG
jgi:hypothetical protein